MASVALETVLLALASDLSAPLALDVSSLDEQESSTAGEVRTYANGRRRSVSRAGTVRSIAVAFDLVAARSTLTTLRSWRGRVVLFRDPYGRKMYGTFFAVDAKERIPVDVMECSLTLTEVSFSEAV